MQPLIFDHVKKAVVQVGHDPASQKQYADLVNAQRPVAAAAKKSQS